MKVIWSSIYYKIEGNYFKRKIWVPYKLKTKTSGKGYSFEIIVLLISVTTLTSRISTWQFKRGSLSMQVTPTRFHISKYLSMGHLKAGTQSFALLFYLYSTLL